MLNAWQAARWLVREVVAVWAACAAGCQCPAHVLGTALLQCTHVCVQKVLGGAGMMVPCTRGMLWVLYLMLRLLGMQPLPEGTPPAAHRHGAWPVLHKGTSLLGCVYDHRASVEQRASRFGREGACRGAAQVLLHVQVLLPCLMHLSMMSIT
jgi:hypothetical protein